MRKNILLFFFLSIATFGYNQSNSFPSEFSLVDRYIDSLMHDWNIPGLALGIVYKDQLIYAKGYGYRDLENKLPMEIMTILPIASNTKLFTATAACILVREGKLNLDSPVREYMPSLKFSNDELNAMVTLRDMLSHRTGLPRYDGIWAGSAFTRKQTIEKVIYMKPQLAFREGFLYNNMMVAAAGAVMETVTGTSWENLIRKLFFQPLQMNSSCFTNEEMMKSGNFAYSYYEPDSTRKLKRWNFVAQSEALGPAGTIKSSIEDMSHWMIAQLNGGKFKGQQVVADSAIKETLVPSNIADKSEGWQELSNPLYCLGRVIQTYKGYKISTHTGAIDGFSSNLTFVPAEKIGIFMIHNSIPANTIRTMMAFPIIDRLMNLSQTNWSDRYMKNYLRSKDEDRKERDSINASQIKNTVPSHPLKDYTGKYSSPIYGDMLVELENNQLILSFRKQRSALHHFHYDRFDTKEDLNGNPNFYLTFLMNSKGEIDRISIRLYGDPVTEFSKFK